MSDAAVYLEHDDQVLFKGKRYRRGAGDVVERYDLASARTGRHHWVKVKKVPPAVDEKLPPRMAAPAEGRFTCSYCGTPGPKSEFSSPYVCRICDVDGDAGL